MIREPYNYVFWIDKTCLTCKIGELKKQSLPSGVLFCIPAAFSFVFTI